MVEERADVPSLSWILRDHVRAEDHIGLAVKRPRAAVHPAQRVDEPDRQHWFETRELRTEMADAGGVGERELALDLLVIGADRVEAVERPATLRSNCASLCPADGA